MRNLKTNTLLFELSKPGRRAARLPACDVPAPGVDELLPPQAIAVRPPPLPELAEPEVVRHFTNLSTLNMSVDTHFYPLGSCTMKYNSKRNERMAALAGIADLHPHQSDETIQGMLELLYGLQEMLAEISGLPAVSLQPAAGAHGELTALMGAWRRAGFEADVEFNVAAGLPGGRREVALFHYAIDGLLLDRLTDPLDPASSTDDIIDALVAGLLPER